MTALIKTLQVLAALATLLGCNIYRYVPERGKFKRRQTLQFTITVMHFIWARPWMYLVVLLYGIFCFQRLMEVLANRHDFGLLLVYYLCVMVLKFQNMVVFVAVLYIYKHYKDQLQAVLNDFVKLYRESCRLNGRAPQINWLLFVVHLKESFSPAAQIFVQNKFNQIPHVAPDSIMSSIFTLSAVIFVCLQPFVLSLLVHLGLLLLHGLHNQPLHLRPCHTAVAYKELLDHYAGLIKLRKNFELFLRPFVWTAIISDLTAFMTYFHIYLYDQHDVTKFLRTMVGALIYPLCLLQQCATINATEQRFGSQLFRFRKNRQKQSQLQIFCLHKLVLFNSNDRSSWNVFQLNRSHVLECVYYGWVLSMFANTLLVGTRDAWLKHFNRTHSKSGH